jgi:dihydrofolate reductase
VRDDLGSILMGRRSYDLSAAQQCLAAGLMDEIQIHLVPVLLGSGAQLFEHLGGQYQLQRTMVVQTPNATQLRFRVIR